MYKVKRKCKIEDFARKRLKDFSLRTQDLFFLQKNVMWRPKFI